MIIKFWDMRYKMYIEDEGDMRVDADGNVYEMYYDPSDSSLNGCREVSRIDIDPHIFIEGERVL